MTAQDRSFLTALGTRCAGAPRQELGRSHKRDRLQQVCKDEFVRQEIKGDHFTPKTSIRQGTAWVLAQRMRTRGLGGWWGSNLAQPPGPLCTIWSFPGGA